MTKKPLNDAQIKVLDEADGLLERALQEAAAKVRPIRDVGEPTGPHCFRCDCKEYEPAMGPGAISLACQRAGCGHSFTSHDVF